MFKTLISLVFVLSFLGCSVSDDVECFDSSECPGTQICVDGVCVDDTGDTGNSGNTGNTGNSGNSGNSGDTGNSGNSGNSGDTSDSGNTGNSGDTGNTGDTGSGPICGNNIVDGDEVCDGNRTKCNEIEGMGYVNESEVVCTTFCDAWVVTDCKCAAGYEKDVDGKCIDIDECIKETDNCAAEGSDCTNTEGSFTCKCQENYEGDGLVCTFCDKDDKCGLGCAACAVETPYCLDNGDHTSKCVECTDPSQCDTVAGEFCTALNKCSLCPLPLTIATWDSDDEGWTASYGAWKRDNTGFMKYFSGAGNTYHKTNYTHYVTSGTLSNLSKCASGKVGYRVMLADDNSDEDDVDKSERLILQCSGDNGGSWNDIKPTTFPSNQSACKDYYCDGGAWPNDKGFGWTDQSINMPEACLTETAKLRFKAWGKDNWLISYWGVDTIIIEE